MRPKLLASERPRELRQNFMRWAHAWIASSRSLGHSCANAVSFLKRAVGMNWRIGNRSDLLRNIASAINERTGSVVARVFAAQSSRREILDRRRTRLLAARLR